MHKEEKMKALNKDILREIKGSMSRFLSIMAIIALGICFFTGVKATGPSMEYTSNKYFQDQKLMDIRLVSTYGFTPEDVEVIKEAQGVNRIMPGYSTDAIITQGDKRLTVKLMSTPEKDGLNQPVVIEGRLPENPGEIVMEAPKPSDEEMIKDNANFKIGESIRLSPEVGDKPLSDYLKKDTYTIVGFVRSPLYVSIERGSTSIGGGELNCYGFVSPGDFSYERFTEVYVLSNASAHGMSAYDPLYNDEMKKLETTLDTVGIDRLEVNHNNIMDKATTELNKAKLELSEARETFNNGIREGEEKLEEARSQLLLAEAELSHGRETLGSELSAAKAKLVQGQDQLAQGEAELLEGQKILESEITSAYQQLNEGIAQLKAGIAEMERNDPSGQLPELEAQLAEISTKVQEAEVGLEELKEGLQAILEQIEALDPTDPGYEIKKEALEAQKGMVKERIQEVQDALTLLYNGRDQIQRGINAIYEFQATLGGLRAQLEDLEINGRERIQQEAGAGQKKLEVGQGELENSRVLLAEGEVAYEAGKTQGYNQLASGQEEINNGWADYHTGEAELATKRASGEAEITKADQKIKDAEKEISEIDFGKFYVFDRSDNVGYSSYGEDSKRIENISGVFPLFFLLVAALVSFTTMTRMVEEQRTQIGTLKALGYGPIKIVYKYFIYALLAAVLGSGVGALIGLNTLPYLIAGAYGLLYQMPSLAIDIPWVPVIISCIAALLCTVTAALGVSYVELRENPSDLMRPKAPKIGKKIFLERIPFIWKHMGFIEKVTARNLMRYKGRFFMTVIGIAGCTALILAGFGLQDAIFSIIPKQFEELSVYDGMLAFKNEETLEQKTETKEGFNNDKHFKENMFIYQTKLNLEKPGESKTKQAYFVVPESSDELKAFVNLRDRKTREPIDLEKSGVVLSEKVARDLNLNVGDKIRIFTDDESHEVTLGAITENYLENFIYVSPKVYNEVFKRPLKVNVAYVNMSDPSKETEEAIANDWLENRGVVAINFTGSIVKSSNDSLSSLNIVVIVMLASAAALAIVVLYNLTNINISERVREIATIRVLGFYDSEVYTYIFRENIILSIIGIIGGLGLGILLNNFIINTVETDIVMFGRGIDLSSYLFAVLFTLIFTFLVNICMTPMIKKISMVESLKSIE